MKGFDVLNVKSAVKTHNKFDLSRSHLTTMDFGEIVPMFAEETIPGDKFNISAEYFSRMAPLVKPTYGKFSYKTVNAFVPYHQLAVDAEAWLAGKTTWEGVTPQQRTISMSVLSDFIAVYCTDSTTSADTFDYTFVGADGTRAYKKFNAKGRYFVKILNALGYALPEAVDYQTGSTWMTQVANVKLSAYPLLAFVKVYNDYMSQSQRFNTSVLSSILNSIKYGKDYVNVYTAATGAISRVGIYTMLNAIYLNYENDYFTSAWQQPNAPINNVEGVTNQTPPASVGVVNDSVNDNSWTSPVVSNAFTVSQRALDFLKSFDDWVRRNNYSGSRAVQQVYSRFGIKTDEYRSHYAHIISTDSMPIQVGDVTATADASGVPLGDYAGKGIMSGAKSIDISVDDYGIILILGYFTVSPMMAFGFDRKVLRNKPLDYYNPEFDGLGADAISLGEVYATPIFSGTDITLDTQVFGYTERYNAYRYGRDMITGDFRDFRKNGDMNVWHTGRNLTDARIAGQMVAQSTTMNTLPQTNSEYNRIFNVTSDEFDHFYVTAKFKVNAVRPMLNLNQVVRLGEGDTAVPRNGNVIS